MTSWLTKSAFKPVPKKDSFMFETDANGFCLQFNQYLYATLYAKSQGHRLYVNDTTNAVSVRYGLIQNTFARVTDLSDVQFRDSQLLTATSLKNRVQPIRDFLSKITPDILRVSASEILNWNSGLLEKIQPLVDEVKAELDIGVHMRTNTMKPIPVEKYLQEVRNYQDKSKKKVLNVFLMSDSPELIKDFTKKKHPSWAIYTLRSPLLMGGHKQLEFNAAPNRVRMDSYLYFLAELYTMQQIPYIICNLGSNVGRFLYLTVADDTTVVSMDLQKFVALAASA
jgi:hypothetical protein